MAKEFIQSSRAPRKFLICAAFVFLFFTIAFHSQSSNVWSRLATASSIVERGTLSIDGDPTTAKSVDKVWIRGSFYSDKQPTMSFLIAGLYYPLHQLGFRLNQRRSVPYVLITFLLIGGSTLLCLAAFHRALGIVGLNEYQRLSMTGGLAFATLLFPWSTTLNNHSFSGAWVFISFYLLLSAKTGPPERVRNNLLLAGAAAGLAAAADSACNLFVVAFGAYISCSKPLRKGLPGYIVFAGLVMLPGVIAGYYITGDLRPIQVHPEYFHYPGSYWNLGIDHLSGISRNDLGFSLRYAYNCLFGPNGFLLYNPLLLIAIFEASTLILRRQPFWQEALVSVAACVGFTGYFFLYSSNYSGHSYSIRWFVSLIPILWFFAFPFFMNLTRTKKWVYGALCCVSILIALVGTVDQWPPTLKFSSTPAFVLNWRLEVRPRVEWFLAGMPNLGKRPEEP